MKKIILNITACMVVANATAQTMDSVLSGIGRNNKTLQAQQQFWEAKKLEYKINLHPDNPMVEYDYLEGSPKEAGNQVEFSVTQSFDFPTSYFKKKTLSDYRQQQAEYSLKAERQDILLAAKNHCIELVYRNKLKVHLANQKQNAEKLLSSFRSRLSSGDGNILDVYKAEINLLEVNKEDRDNLSAIAQLTEELTLLNGGIPTTFSDTSFNTIPAIPSFSELEKEYETADPLRLLLEQERLISEKQIEVSRSLSLPRFEAGYHYQGILGQKYNGIHAGITIPMWENVHTVKHQKASYRFAALAVEAHRNEHYYEIKQLYQQYENLRATLTDYENAFQSMKNVSLLDKAFALGEISSVEYFLELNFYRAALKNYLETEKEFHLTVSRLYKYQL